LSSFLSFLSLFSRRQLSFSQTSNLSVPTLILTKLVTSPFSAFFPIFVLLVTSFFLFVFMGLFCWCCCSFWCLKGDSFCLVFMLGWVGLCFFFCCCSFLNFFWVICWNACVTQVLAFWAPLVSLVLVAKFLFLDSSSWRIYLLLKIEDSALKFELLVAWLKKVSYWNLELIWVWTKKLICGIFWGQKVNFFLLILLCYWITLW
jgi:hypothetical protein